MTVAVVTGATGLLGANAAIALAQRGYHVRGLCRDPARTRHLSDLPIEWAVADLSDRASLSKAFRGAGAVIHCAGDTTQSRWLTPALLSANVRGTRNVIAASAGAGIGRLVHCSSTTTCGVARSERPADENSLERGESVLLTDGYTRSKYTAERLAREATARMDVVIVNPGYLLGPFDRKPTSGRLLLRIAEGKAPGWPTGWNSFVDVRDVAEGIVHALERGRRGERYILSGENLPYRTVMHVAAKRLGVPPPRFPVPHVVARMAGLAGDAKDGITRSAGDINSATVQYGYSRTFRFSSAKAEKELGYTARPVQQAIEAAIDWFARAGMLPPR